VTRQVVVIPSSLIFSDSFSTRAVPLQIRVKGHFTVWQLNQKSWQIPVLEGALAYARQAIVPGGTFTNQIYLDEYISYSSNLEDAIKLLLADPQTSGGLLFALNEKDAQELVRRLQDHVAHAEIIGVATKEKEYRIYVE
ncbi:MAG TPA: hypothetical protein DF480_05425, partial [Clostridiales bacterium]|nr:hypothetical protein [Clostridiales bacterium]